MNGPAEDLTPSQSRETAVGVLPTPDFRLIFESLPGLVMILLPDAPRFTIATCSDAYLAATLTQRHIFGHGLFQVFPDNPKDPAADGVHNLRASLNRVVESRRADTMALQKYDVERPDGSGFEEKWWSPVNTPVLVDGEISYIIHVASDVTDEVLLKRESAKQDSLLTALVEALPSGVMVSDVAGNMLVNNPAAQAITRLPTQDIPADPADWPRHFGMHTPQGHLLPLSEVPLGRALKGETVKQQELLIRNAYNGEGVHVTFAARPLQDAGGTQIGALTVFTDISERVAAEHERAERADALERAKIAINAARIAPFTWYVERDFIETDSLGETLHGLGAGAALGTMAGYLARVHPEDADMLAANLRGLVESRQPDFTFEYRTISAQGRVRWVRSVGSLSTDGGLVRVTGAMMDATIEVEVQRALEDRTREMERANSELDEFTYIASHDLKEPLRGIHNYARFLAEDYADKLDAGGQHMLSAVSQQAERMQRLIEDLLEIARLGREPMQRSETDLDAVVDEVLASLHFSLAEKKMDVRRHALGRVVCDRVRVAEVFRNLITNALKYNDKPVPVIEIGIGTAATGETEFYVQDNGIGIKPEFHARVFAAFKRLHAKEAYGGGTGVGLAIVKRIVEAHGGHIGVSSEPGLGATFAFTLSGELPRD